MTVGGISLNPYTFQNVIARRNLESVEQPQTQVQQAKDMMMQVLEFAFYKQQDMNLKLVRLAGELYQGKSIDVYA